MVFVLKDLYIFLKSNKIISALLIIAQVITLVGVFSTYNYYLENFQNTRSLYEDMRTFRINHPDSNNLSSNLKDLVNSQYSVQHVYTFASSDDNRLDISKNQEKEGVQNATGEEADQEGVKKFCGDYYGQTVRKHSVLVGSYLTDTDHQQASNHIVLSSRDYYLFQAGDTYYINGKAFNVIGISSDENAYVSYETFLKYQLPVTGVEVILSEEIGETRTKEFVQYLSGLFGTDEILSPAGEYGENITNYRYVFAVCVLFFALSFIGFVYLYAYILDKRKKQYAILRVYGCTKLRGALIYLAEYVLVSLLSYLLSVVLFNFLVTPLVKLVDTYTVLVLDVNSYLTILALYLIVLLCIVIPTIVRHAKKEIVSQYRN